LRIEDSRIFCFRMFGVLSLEDFMTFIVGEKIASKPTTCPNNNAGLGGAVKHASHVANCILRLVWEVL
jgi:hypothetical protein